MNFFKRIIKKIKNIGLIETLELLTARLISKLESPGELLRPTLLQRNRYVEIKELFFCFRKRKTTSKFNANKSLDTTLKIDKDLGYIKLPANFIEYAQELNDYITNEYKIKKILANFEDFNKKNLGVAGDRSGFISLLEGSKDQKILFKFLTEPKLLSIIQEYLGTYPWLYSCSLQISNEIKMYENTSQNFHMDWEDKKILKVFFFLNDIDDNSGPFSIIDAKSSKKVTDHYQEKYKKNIISQRLSDEMVFSVVNKNKLVKAIGVKNEIFIADTCNLLHYGSRPSSKNRIMISCMYASPFSLCKWNKPIHRDLIKTDLNLKDWRWSLIN